MSEKQIINLLCGFLNMLIDERISRFRDYVHDIDNPKITPEHINKLLLGRNPFKLELKSPDKQITALKEQFSFLPIDKKQIDELTKQSLPRGFDGWAIIPKPEKLGFPYPKAIIRLLILLGNQDFFDHTQWVNKEKNLEELIRIDPKTLAAHEKLNAQDGNYWIFPVCLGDSRRGKTITENCQSFYKEEFWLGLYELAVLILTHPEWIGILDTNLFSMGTLYWTRKDDVTNKKHVENLGLYLFQGNNKLKIYMDTNVRTSKKMLQPSGLVP